jgi:8-oxo-dGTP pyrophosphatase MutT (NUDIX family)
MRVINREIVSAHIYSSDGKLLFALGAPGAVYPNTWKIPGGGVDDGETREQALVREIKEETGIDTDGLSFELLVDDMTGEAEKTLKDTGERVLAKMKFYTYKVILPTTAAQTAVMLEPHEFTEYKWVDLSELKQLTLSPPSAELNKRLGFI